MVNINHHNSCVCISPTPTVSPTRSVTPTRSLTPTVSPTRSVTPTTSVTPTPTPTQTRTPCPLCPSSTPTPTISVSPTETITPTPTPTQTPTISISPTKTPTVTPTTTSCPECPECPACPSQTPECSATSTPTYSPSSTSTSTPTVTPTTTPTVTPSQSPTQTPPCSPPPTQTPECSATSTMTPTVTPTSTPDNCCDWNGEGNFISYDECGWDLKGIVKLNKISDYQWSKVEIVDCENLPFEIFNILVTCDKNIVYIPSGDAGRIACEKKWSIQVNNFPCLDGPYVIQMVNENNIDSFGFSQDIIDAITSTSDWPNPCSCDQPPYWAIYGQHKFMCDCCSPTPTPTSTQTLTPTPTPTKTPPFSYDGGPLSINSIP